MLRSLVSAMSNAVLIAACDTDPVRVNAVAGQYDLVQLGAATPPIAFEPYQAPNAPMTCTDTLHSQTIQHRADRTAARTSITRTYCAGLPPSAPANAAIPGAYTMNGDSITLTFSVSSSEGGFSMTWADERSANELIFRQPVYTEADPDGKSGNTMIWRYRRR